VSWTRTGAAGAVGRGFTASLRELATSYAGAVVVRADGPAFSAGHDLSDMVNHTLGDEREVFAVCAEMMETIQSIPQPARIGKQAFYRQIDLPQAEAYADMREVMATNAMTCDAQEGMQAFLGKRAPVWQGR
jgi:Enoyl-CoA hydratase/carnithine racemase